MTVKPKLPDGRPIRALEGTYTQKMMFTLRSSGLYAPATEGIMSVKDHDQSIQSGAYKSVNVNDWWRTGAYAFYPSGFEKANLPLGDKLVYAEDGVRHTLNIPDVQVSMLRPDGRSETVGLRQAIGMGVIKLEKLKLDQTDDEADVVSVTTDFDPATDVKVVDVMRPRAWALVDVDGYPLKSQPSCDEVSEARYSWIRHKDDFEKGSTGYHGSLAHLVGGDYYLGRRYVYAFDYWSWASGVAVVGRDVAVAAGNSVPLVRSVEQARAAAPCDVK